MKTNRIIFSSFLSVLILLYSIPSFTRDAYLNELQNIDRGPGNRSRAEVFYRKGMDAHTRGDYASSERNWYLAAKADPSWAKVYFNLACATALQGKHESALGYLDLALGLDAENLLLPARNDSDLKGIRGRPAYEKMLKKYDQQPPGSGEPAITATLVDVSCFEASVSLIFRDQSGRRLSLEHFSDPQKKYQYLDDLRKGKEMIPHFKVKAGKKGKRFRIFYRYENREGEYSGAVRKVMVVTDIRQLD